MRIFFSIQNIWFNTVEYCFLTYLIRELFFLLEIKMVRLRRLSRLTKVNLGWSLVIMFGLGSFALARKSIQNQRYDIMKAKQKIKDACKQDQLEESMKSIKS